MMKKMSYQSQIDNEKIDRIREIRKKLATIEWIIPEKKDFPNENDADIYSV